MSRVLVFDLDDTLYPERQFVLGGFAAVGGWLQERHGLAGFAEEAGRVFAEGMRGRIFDEALHRLGAEGAAGLVPQMVAVYREHRPRLELFPDAAWALGRFSGNLRLGLVTDGFAATQRNKVAALGIEPSFQAIVYSDDLGRENWKPSPEPFRRIMAALACAPATCVYVADNPAKDFLAPNQLGWRSVQLLRAGGEYSALRPDGLPAAQRAQIEIGSLLELEEILK